MDKKLKIDYIKTPTQLGVAIKRLRKSKGLSQSELSKMMNMRQPTISDIENGKGTIDSLFKIIQALGVNLSAANHNETNSGHQDINDMLNLIED